MVYGAPVPDAWVYPAPKPYHPGLRLYEAYYRGSGPFRRVFIPRATLAP